MAKRVQLIRHTTAGATAFTGFVGEVTALTDAVELRLHDGVTAGGGRIPGKTTNDTLYQAKAAKLTALSGGSADGAASGTIDGVVIGGTTPAAATITNLTLTGTGSFSPANASVTLSPTGSGVVTINPATAGSINNVTIGASTALTGKFTTLTATAHTVFEGVTSTGATGTGKFVYDTGATIAGPTITGTLTGSDAGTWTSAGLNSLVGVGVGTAAVANRVTVHSSANNDLSTRILLENTNLGNATQVVINMTSGATGGGWQRAGSGFTTAFPVIASGSYISDLNMVVGTNTTNPFYLIYNNSKAITINSAASTGLQFNGYGAGTITADSSGNLTSVSDEGMKINVSPYTFGIDALRTNTPKSYQYSLESGLDPVDPDYPDAPRPTYTGYVIDSTFASTFSEAVFCSKDGLLSVWERAITARIHNVVIDHDDRVIALETANAALLARIAALEACVLAHP